MKLSILSDNYNKFWCMQKFGFSWFSLVRVELAYSLKNWFFTEKLVSCRKRNPLRRNFTLLVITLIYVFVCSLYVLVCVCLLLLHAAITESVWLKFGEEIDLLATLLKT